MANIYYESDCVIADGPYDAGDYPEWYVFAADDDGEPLDEDRVMTFHGYKAAVRYGRDLADKYGLEFVNEAVRA